MADVAERPGRTGLRWLLLCALLLGLIGMHNLVLPGPAAHAGGHQGMVAMAAAAPAHTAQPAPSPQPGGHQHGPAHLCLAILLAAAAALVLCLLRHRHTGDLAPRAMAGSRTRPGRAPPPFAPPADLLARLCVLRL